MEQKVKDIRVAACMTAPRYENTYARGHIERALKELGIPLTVSLGVFYGQCMQKMLESLVALGNVTYAITIDFDSLFTAQQLERLLAQIMQHDEIDAIAPLQVKRSKPHMLGTVHGGERVGDNVVVQWDGKPMKGRTAHFGLTVIDLEKLSRVPKPWFVATPNAAGSWDSESIDDDVHFWFQWERAGNSVYFDPGVRIGHLEEMVVVHDEKMQPMHIYPADWERAVYAS